MRRFFLAFAFCLISSSVILTAAETLDKSKFVAPSSQKSNLSAPTNSNPLAKAPGVVNPAVGSTAPGGEAPVAPVNGLCPSNYHCNVSGAAPRCFPNRGNLEIGGPDSCFNVERLCKVYSADIAAGNTLDESDAQKFAYYCK